MRKGLFSLLLTGLVSTGFALTETDIMEKASKHPIKKEGTPIVEKKLSKQESLQLKIEKLKKNFGLECAPQEIAYAETYLEVYRGLKLGDKKVSIPKFEKYKLLKEAEFNIMLAESKIKSDMDKDGVPCYMEIIKGTDPNKPDVAVKEENRQASIRTVSVKPYKEKKNTEKVSQKDKTFKPLKLHARIHFDFDKATIKKDYLPYLNVITRYLKRHPDMKVKIVGYTDSIGSKEYNEKLALKRAKAVKDFLVKKGIPENRIEIAGIGKDKYLFDNNTEVNRFTNRRAEFFVMEVK